LKKYTKDATVAELQKMQTGMKDIIYKEFMPSVHYSAIDETIFGQIQGTNDLVTFEGQTVKALKAAFEEELSNDE